MAYTIENTIGCCPTQANNLLVACFGTRRDNQFDKPSQKNFCIYSDDKLVGVAINRCHPVPIIENQLYLEEKNGYLKLIKFKDMVQQSGIVLKKSVIEFAYMTIEPGQRQHGFDKKLFDIRMNDSKENYSEECVMFMPRTSTAGIGIADKVTQIMLAIENSVNGSTNGKTNIKGEWISKHTLEEQLQMKLNVGYYAGDPAITHLAEKNNFTPVGFFRNFCPVWIRKI